MITFDEARALAYEIASKSTDHPVYIVDDATMERPFGWVFFYNTVSLRGTDRSLIGNAPVIVNRHTGTPSRMHTSGSVEDHVEAYEALGRERYDAGEWREYLRRKMPVDPAVDDVFDKVLGPPGKRHG